jgi:hypothetical protein
VLFGADCTARLADVPTPATETKCLIGLVWSTPVKLTDPHLSAVLVVVPDRLTATVCDPVAGATR